MSRKRKRKPADVGRFRKGQEIASSPDGYAVCMLCQSIVTATTYLCPLCHGYRFNSDPRLVVSWALELAFSESQTVPPLGTR